MIRSRIYLCLVLLLLGSLCGLAVWAQGSVSAFMVTELPARRQLVRTLQLTDLSLWTEARYTRHPAMADLFSPYQDNPAAFEHFPAGSLMSPSSPRPSTTLQVQRQRLL
ncbi:MAG: hypothetical protein ACWGOL_11295 [Desulfuromonadales bacterium]